MARKRYTVEQINTKLREAEVELAKGSTAIEVCRKLGISEQTYYRWRKEYGGLRTDEARRLKEVLDEQSAFAAEQIGIAIDALGADIKQVPERLKEVVDSPVMAAEDLKANANFYQEHQQELVFFGGSQV